MTQITFILTNQGRVLVDDWPKAIEITAALLDRADPRRIEREGDVVRFRVDNGCAIYRLGLLDERGVYTGTRLACELRTEGR